MVNTLTVKELLEFIKNNNISEDAKIHSCNNEGLLNPVIEAKGKVIEYKEYEFKEEILILEYVE